MNHLLKYVKIYDFPYYDDKLKLFKLFGEEWRSMNGKSFVGPCVEIVKKSNAKTLEDFFNFYITYNISHNDKKKRGRTKNEIINLAFLYRQKCINKDEQNAPKLISDYIDIVIYHIIHQTYAGHLKEKKVLNTLLNNGFLTRFATEEEDKEGIDLVANINGINYGIQIKPISFFLGSKSDLVKDRMRAYCQAIQSKKYKLVYLIYKNNKWLKFDDKNFLFDITKFSPKEIEGNILNKVKCVEYEEFHV